MRGGGPGAREGVFPSHTPVEEEEEEREGGGEGEGEGSGGRREEREILSL